jgi:flagellar biosynthetic protein FliQ
MNTDIAAKLFSSLMIDALVVSAPLLLTTLVVGVAISILQVVTQVQEMSLTFVPKIVAAVGVLLLAGPWMLNYLVSVATRLIATIPALV